MKTKVFIDGSEGTTGLRIHERFQGRDDIELLKIDSELRKDPEERKRLINSSDITFLCLPDVAARESVSLVENENVVIIDSREYKRYIGEFEPVDKKAGHIPGAVNYFWMDILEKDDDKLYLKSQNELKKQFAELMDYDEVIVYCGSGITACPNSLALSEAGIRHKLYAGSFSDWISYDENIVETK